MHGTNVKNKIQNKKKVRITVAQHGRTVSDHTLKAPTVRVTSHLFHCLICIQTLQRHRGMVQQNICEMNEKNTTQKKKWQCSYNEHCDASA